MATEFNAADYFNRRTQALDASDRLVSSADKLTALETSIAAKKAALAQMGEVAGAAEEAHKASWVGQLGLDKDGIAPLAVNAVAQAYKGTSRVAGNTVAFLAGDIPAMLLDSTIPEETKQALNRYQAGTATQADVDLITTKMSGADSAWASTATPEQREAMQRAADVSDSAETPLQVFDRSVAARQRGANLRESFDRSSTVQPEAQNRLAKELGDGFQEKWDRVTAGARATTNGSVVDRLTGAADVVSGLGQLLYKSVEAGVTHPAGAFGYIMENVPQLAIGAVSPAALAATNVAYASENYQKGIAKWQKNNNGAYPPEAQRMEMAAWAASTALAEQGADMLHLSNIGIGKATKALRGETKAIEGALDGAAKAMEKGGVGAALKRIGVATGLGSVEEAVTEGFQTFAEGEASLEPATAQQIYEGASIGAMAGGGLSGGGRAIAEGARGASNMAAAAKQKSVEAAETNEAFEAAAATGDVSKLLDPKEYTYAPDLAVSALVSHNQQEGTTEVQKEANTKKVNEIVADLEQAQTKARDVLAAVNPDRLEGLKAQRDEAIAQGDTDLAATYQEVITDVESLDPKELKRMERNVERAEKRLTRAREALEAFNATAEGVSVEEQAAAINTNVDASDAPAVASRTAAADKVINLAMSSPEQLSSKAALDLADNKDNGLTDTQRTYLRAFSEARLAENALLDMGNVSQRVFVGQGRDVGLKQYRDRVASALEAGNQRVANRNLRDLANFNESHQGKAQAAEQAWAAGPGTQIQKSDKGGWFVATPEQELSARALKNNGGMPINSERLVNQIRTEAAAISATLAELQAAVAMKNPAKEAQNVPHVPQAHDSSPQAPSAGKAANDSGAVPPREAGDGTVAARADTKAAEPAQPAAKPAVVAESKAEPATAPAQESGKVAALESNEASSKLYTQSEGKKGSTSVRPLVAVKDFLSTGFDKAVDFLANKDLSEKQKGVLDTFELAAKSWMKHLDAGLFARPDARFFSEDAIQYLQTVDGDLVNLDENVKTAMVYAGFSWIAENAARSRYNTDKEINNILQRPEDSLVSRDASNLLREVGGRQSTIVNVLGRRAAQALGITAKPDAPADALPRLESSLGVHILRMLEAANMVERTEVSGQEFAALTKSSDTNVAAKQQFVRVLYKGDQPGRSVARVMDSVKGTQGVLDKLFGVESGYKEPTFEPVRFNQKTTSGTRQGIPSSQAELVNKSNQEENFLREDMYQVITTIDEDLMVRIAGGQSVDPRKVHAANQKGRQAKNDGLLGELRRMKDFVAGMGAFDQALYFEHAVWKQGRVGIATNAINPQTSKIHRHMLFRKTWDTKVARNDPAQMENFHLRVAEGLGIKTDKQSNEVSLAKYEAEVNKPIIQEAVAALGKTLDGEGLTRAEQETIAAAVGGNGMHGLDALVALAHEARGEPTFNVQLMGEVDGVTNGPMLANFLLGAGNTVGELFSLLNRGGFYEVGSDFQNYNVWRGSGGKLDLYEQTISNVMSNLSRMKNVNKTVLASVYAFTGTLQNEDTGDVEKAGRNIIKTPLTAMVYGSAIKGAIDSMSDNFVDSIYEKIEALQTDDPKMSKAAILANLRTFGVNLNEDITNQQLLDYVFNTKETTSIKRAFENTLGKAVASTMKQDFSVFMERRNEFNMAAQATFEIYNSVYQALRQAKIAELVASGEIETDAKGNPKHSLSPKQEAALRAELDSFSPVVHTAMSAADGELGAGLALAKTEATMSTESTYRSQVKMGAPFKNGARSAYVNAFQQVESNPGVGALVMQIHSSDAGISIPATGKGSVLNIHDANGAGLATFTQTARNLNEQTFKVMLNYSPANEIFKALMRTVEGLAAYVEAQGKDMPAGVRENLAAALTDLGTRKDLSKEDVLMALVLDTQSMAYEADFMRLEVAKNLQSVDQYALQGGQYDVTAKDRGEAASRQAELARFPAELQIDAVEVLNDFIAGRVTAAELESQIDTAEMDLDILAEPADTTTPFGAVGESMVASDPKVAEFLTKPRSVKEVIGFLLEGLKGKDAAAAKASTELLKKVRDTLGTNIEVTMVTPETDPSTVLEVNENARGWYVAKDGKEAIYVLAPQFASSGLTAETLLHELVHASLAKTIQAEQDAAIADPSYKSDALALINELEALRVKAQKQAAGTPGFEAALSNVQEFVAWGMTNRAFQRDVISKVSMKSKTKGNALVQGMKAFIDTLVGILFKGTDRTHQAVAVNGMTVLVQNVSGLFAAAGTPASRADLNLAMASPMGQVQDLSTLDIHDALSTGNVTPEFDAHLKGLLTGIVENLHGPFGSLQKARMAQQAMTPLDVWQKALLDGVAPFASDTLASGFTISGKEAFVMEQVEATVLAALENGTPEAFQVLSDLYTEVQEKLTPADFSSQELYDFVFKIDSAKGGKSAYLARFAALGLANQEFNKLLQTPTSKAVKPQGKVSLATRLQNFFEKVLSFFQEKATKTYAGQNADAKLESLVGTLVDIEAKRRTTIARNATKIDILAPMENAIVDAAEATRKKIGQIAASNFFKNSKSGIVQGVSAVARTVANDRVDQFLDGVMQLRDKAVQGRLGVASGLLRDVRGPLDVFKSLLINTKNNERERKAIITAAAKAARMAFGTEKMKNAEKHAVTAVFLRTGAHVLQADHSLSEIHDLLLDGKKREAEMTKLEDQLSGFGSFKNYFINQANGLGYMKATGRARVAEQMQNAHNIARAAGTPFMGRLTEEQSSKAEPVIQKLVALYALDYLDAGVRNQAASVLKAQNARKDGNGVDFAMKLQARLEAESLERLFGDQKALMIHGYTPEIYNPHTDLRTADATEGAQLKLQGYSEGAQVTGDPTDPNGSGKRIYVLRDGGLAPRLTGIMSYTGMNSKGTKQHNGYMSPTTADGQANVTMNNEMTAKKDAAVRAQFKAGARPDLRNAQGNMLVPLMNESGEVVNRRYMMEDSTKNALLERNNDFSDILGAMAGSIYDKQSSREQNREAIKAAKDLYTSQAATQGSSYVLVGPRSTDADLREIWRLLPDSTKDDARAIWGKDGMYIRNDSLDIMFGYKKQSLADVFRKDPSARNMLENVFVNVMEHVLTVYGGYKHGLSPKDAEEYAKRAAVVVTRGERAWQELVRETKDLIVIKTGVVMMGNIWSNFSLLYLSGVSFKDIAVGHAVAMKGATRYQRDSAELAQLQMERDTGYTSGPDIERQIARLEDAIARNPVKELIDAGLMPTIVEDIAMSEDPFSYKSALARKVEGVTSKLPPAVTAAAKQVYMAHDTGMYKALNRITQLSDFVARYTLYQHLITRKKKPLSKEAAILEASDAFINYDVPMHRGMQYMDDMGITMFTKYFLRIQRILLKIGRENPARVMMTVALNNLMDLGPIVLDSTALGRIGNNPFGLGPLNYPGTLDQLGTVSAAMALVK